MRTRPHKKALRLGSASSPNKCAQLTSYLSMPHQAFLQIAALFGVALTTNLTLQAQEPRLRLQAAEGAPASETHELSWFAIAGRSYDLKTSPDLYSWNGMSGFPVAGNGEEMKQNITLDSAPSFYRLNEIREQKRNLPVPADGRRIDSQAELDGPKWPETYGEGHVTLWYDGKFAAYSVTIDDNNYNDVPYWLSLSEEYGWKFTWFVIVHPYVWDIYNDAPGSNTGYFGTLAEWKTLHDLGHDIQLHGSCSEMNDLTAADYQDHVQRSINVLETNVGTEILTYAYPCGATSNGEHDYRSVISNYMIGARGTSGGVTPIHLLDYLNTKSLGGNSLVDGEPSSRFSRYNTVRNFDYSQYRGWCVTLYHGMNGGPSAALEELLDWVKAHEDEFWVAPFTDVAKYSQERESSTLDFLSVEPDQIEFTIVDNMDDAIFDHPVTVKIRLDNSWSTVQASQGGQSIDAKIVEHEGNNYALVYPVPDQGVVVVTQ